MIWGKRKSSPIFSHYIFQRLSQSFFEQSMISGVFVLATHNNYYESDRIDSCLSVYDFWQLTLYLSQKKKTNYAICHTRCAESGGKLPLIIFVEIISHQLVFWNRVQIRNDIWVHLTRTESNSRIFQTRFLSLEKLVSNSSILNQQENLFLQCYKW